ncbi:hypothetical protein F511_37670 [Dorcoceras hygrometricum]|uniref:Uncharacterized protein n=1 Tax=Dorcoceras hygrometricum TaxID=472368 RepID=A0A2Z7C5Y4_9LAMI|nr:hypothetical protein F511_37670 [Dorcoceras hygrometricum]
MDLGTKKNISRKKLIAQRRKAAKYVQQLRNESAAKQLTTYEELSKLNVNSELNSNEESDKKPAKEKDTNWLRNLNLVLASEKLLYAIEKTAPKRTPDISPEELTKLNQCRQFSRCYLELAIAKRCRLHKLIRQRFALAIKIQQEDFALLFQQTKLQKIQSQRKDSQTQCFEHPVARRFRRSFWTTRRKQQQHPVKSLFVSAVAIYSVARYSAQSQEIQAQRIEEVAKRSSRGDKSAAKQLTNYQS